jgi:hypothetical protein
LLYKVAYDEAVRALSEQRDAIDSFRTRAGLLLSAAAITTSFLGAQALEGGSPEPVRREQLHRDLALDMQGSYLENRKGLEKLVVFFQVANVLLAIEVVLWMIAIAMAK